MKNVNYTKSEIDALIAGYNPEASESERDEQVVRLAEKLGRKKQSVIAKLVNLKIYRKKETVKKGGGITKEARIMKLARTLGVLPELLDSLAKANISVIKMFQDVADEWNELQHSHLHNESIDTTDT